MKDLKPIFVSVALTTVLVGCSSPKDASKDNFKKVINEYLDRNCIMISPRNIKFPVTIELLPPDNVWATKTNPGKIQEYEALVSTGMLEVQDGSAQANKDVFSTQKITVPTKTYSLTDKGKKAFKKNTGKGYFIGSNQGFCVATLQVNEVTSFSEPSQAMGYTISNVNYSQSPKNTKDWANNEDIVKAFPHFAQELEENQQKSATLVLMNDGWVHESELNK
jgi:DNA-binding PadR family transcriptional regulator